MEMLQEVGVFFLEAAIVVLAGVLLIAAFAGMSGRKKNRLEGQIEVTRLNDRYEGYRDAIREHTEHAAEAKARQKAEKAAAKADDKKAKQRAKKGKDVISKPRLFVIDFEGDAQANQVDALREEVSAVLPELRPGDEVLLRLESPGGVVHGYGLAASQLTRVRSAGYKLVVAVDKVAASGGYMMACVADELMAAPFAVIGSIGVVAQLPNFHKLLKKNDIDVELLTAGEYKRTLTLFGENTDKDREKFQQDLDDIHDLFKAFVKEQRPVVDVEAVATGEIWFGQRALDQQLIDAISTSDDYIQARLESHDILAVSYSVKTSWQEKLGLSAEAALDRVLLRWWQRGQRPLP